MSEKKVRMLHTDPAATGGPTTAEVPESGVEMMRRVGWALAPEQAEAADSSGQGEKSLEEMTVAELREHAREQGIPIPATSTTKAAILEVIGSAEAAKSRAAPTA